MILIFREVVTADELRTLRGLIASAPFVEGRATAGHQIATVKHNEQLARDAPQLQPIAELVLAALRRHQPFRDATYPKQLHSLMVSRYVPGMAYGQHVDNPLMGDTVVWRSDLSITLFLSPSSDYDGGELALDTGNGEQLVKLEAGDLVCYATGRLHRVTPVTRGERLAVVAWIQSHVRDERAREALRDLAEARELEYVRSGKSRVFDLIVKTHANLLRRWAEP